MFKCIQLLDRRISYIKKKKRMLFLRYHGERKIAKIKCLLKIPVIQYLFQLFLRVLQHLHPRFNLPGDDGVLVDGVDPQTDGGRRAARHLDHLWQELWVADVALQLAKDVLRNVVLVVKLQVTEEVVADQQQLTIFPTESKIRGLD